MTSFLLFFSSYFSVDVTLTVRSFLKFYNHENLNVVWFIIFQAAGTLIQLTWDLGLILDCECVPSDSDLAIKVS